MDDQGSSFSTELEVRVYTRQAGETGNEWQEAGQGPGIFHFDPGVEVMVRAQRIDNRTLRQLAADLKPLSSLRALVLAENRNVTDDGVAHLTELTQLRILNLSSCDITGEGLAHLKSLPHLAELNLSFCNRLTESALRPIKALTHLTYLDLQGTIKIKRGWIPRLERHGLTIRR